MLTDMSCDNLAMLGAGVGEDVLNQIIAILVAGNINQRDSRSVHATLADAIEIASKKLGAANLQTLLDYLGCILVHAVLGCKTNDMVDSAAAVGRCTMLANMLNTPVAELPMSNDVDVLENLFNARSLSAYLATIPTR